MQDYEIRDVMNRTKHPEISLGFELDSLSIRNDSGVNTYLSLKVFIINVGSVYANYVNVVVQIPAFICSENYYNKLTHNDIEMVVINGDNTTRDLLDVQYTVSGTKEKRGPARYVPVLPGRSLLSLDIRLVSDSLRFQDKSELPIRWKIYADNAEVKEGESSFKNIETVYRSM